MKNKIFLIFILLVSARAYSISHYSVNGQVIDAQTKEPIFFVNVFLSNTTLGSTTTSEGNFIINNIPAGRYDLIIQHIGYELKKLSIDVSKSNHNNNILIELQPAIIKGEMVQVTGDIPKEWKKRLQTFTRKFLGETTNAAKCKILNPEVINFTKENDTGALIASSDSLIHVENRALGYHIEIILENFILQDYVKYNTILFFKEMQPKNPKEMEKWEKQRYKTYQGSFKHFLSALARNKIDKEQFHIYKGIVSVNNRFGIEPGEINKYSKELVTDTNLNGIKKIHFNDILVIDSKYFPQKKHPTKKRPKNLWYSELSFIKMKTDEALVDTLGNPYNDAFKINGYWRDLRIADTLPLNYK